MSDVNKEDSSNVESFNVLYQVCNEQTSIKMQ